MKFLLKYLFLLPIILSPFVVRAEISVTEIMYDHSGADTDLEWVEYYNSGGDTVSLSGWKFNDGANHTLNNPPMNGGMGSLEIGPGEYIVLAGNANVFLGEFTSFAGTLIDTVMSLTNTTDTISLIDDTDSTASTYTYNAESGGAGDGTSLSKIGGIWKSGTPTPGKINSESVVDDNPDDGGEGSESTTSTELGTEEAEIEAFIPPEFAVEILSDIIIVSGVASTFDVYLKNAEGEEIRGGQFVWNMGDGTEYFYKPAKEFEHVYQYPGEYVILLEYYRNGGLEKEDTDRLVVKVVNALVTAKILDGGVVEVANTSAYEQDLSGWILTTEMISYKFPKNSVLLAGKQITLSPRVTHFLPQTNSVSLLFPTGEIAYQYPLSLPQTPVKQVFWASSSANNSIVRSPSSSQMQVESLREDNSALQAAAGSAPLPSKNFVYLGFIGVIILAVGSIFYTRNMLKKEKSSSTSADEFEFIEE